MGGFAGEPVRKGDHGKTPFVIYQGVWNVMARSFERDIIPMARSLGKSIFSTSHLLTSPANCADMISGLALAPFRVLGGGQPPYGRRRGTPSPNGRERDGTRLGSELGAYRG